MKTRLQRLYNRAFRSAINLIDENDSDLPNTNSLLPENEYPAGEMQDKQILFPEKDFGHTMRIEGAEDISNSAMLAIFPSNEAAAIVDEFFSGTETADDLHVTVLYLGKDFSDDDLLEIAGVAAQVADSHEALQCKVQGLGVFNGNGDGRPVYCSVDAIGLASLHTDLVDSLADAGVNIESNYDFTPHMTVSYADDMSDMDIDAGAPDIEWESSSLFLVVGNEIIEEFKLGGHDKSAGGFGLNIQELITPSEGQGFTDNPADNHQTENLCEDVDLKLGEVEEPYSQSQGPLNVRFDEDHKFDITKGADEKEAVGQPTNEPNENRYGPDHLREDQSIPRDPSLEGPIYGR